MSYCNCGGYARGDGTRHEAWCARTLEVQGPKPESRAPGVLFIGGPIDGTRLAVLDEVKTFIVPIPVPGRAVFVPPDEEHPMSETAQIEYRRHALTGLDANNNPVRHQFFMPNGMTGAEAIAKLMEHYNPPKETRE